MHVKSQWLVSDMEQRTDSKLGKEYVRIYIVMLFIQLIYRVHHARLDEGQASS